MKEINIDLADMIHQILIGTTFVSASKDFPNMRGISPISMGFMSLYETFSSDYRKDGGSYFSYIIKIL